jgi:tetratricopeptide (TPR) repeat protein
MSNLFLRVVGWCLGVLAGTIPGWAHTEPNQQISHLRFGLVEVVVYDKGNQPLTYGRGFFINTQGHVVTNYHILSRSALMGADRASIRTSKGQEYPIQSVVAENRDVDLIQVLVNIPPIALQPLTISKTGPKVAERIFVIGNPGPDGNKVYRGHITAMEEIPSRGAFCRITVPVKSGLSGSPVFNEASELVAVACGHHIEGLDVGYAIPINLLAALQSKKKTESLSRWFTRTAGQPNAAQDTLKNAVVMLRAGYYPQALNDLRIIVRRNPRLSEAWYLTGHGHYKLHHYNQAVSSFMRALEIQPDYSDAYFGLGLVYLSTDRNDKAVTAFQRVIENMPDSAPAYFNLGLAYERLGNIPETIKAMRQAVKNNPEYTEAYYRLGVAYHRGGNLRLSLASYQKTLKLQPDYTEAYYSLGMLYGNLRLYHDAIRSFKKAIQIQPGYAEAYFNLGLTYREQENYSEAIDAFQQGLKFKPEESKGFYYLGLLLRKTDKHEEAIQALEQAVQKKPDFVDARYELGCSYLQVHRKAAAMAEYFSLQKLDKDKAAQLYDLIMK